MNISILILTAAVAQDTVDLSAAAAMEMAWERNRSARAMEARADAASARALGATQAFLPDVSVGWTGIRTTDPVAVFGAKLRQENFQGTDLALDPLNRPDPYNTYELRGTIRQPILSPEGLFGYRAARLAAEASGLGASRARGVAAANTLRVYAGALLAEGQVTALESALDAAMANAERAQDLETRGLTTGLDARLATIHAARIESQLVGARATYENALGRLRWILDLDAATVVSLSDSLDVYWLNTLCNDCDSERSDLLAARTALDAARNGVKSAVGSNLPSVVAFADVASHGRTLLLGSGSGDWTVGIAVVWNPFPALSGLGSVREARAERFAREEMLESLTREIETERETARRNVAAAESMLAVSEAALEQAETALLQAHTRYDNGISTITELLEVQAARDGAELALIANRHERLVAAIALADANGAFDR